MRRRRDTLLIIGAVMIVIGGTLYFNPLGNETWWVEWVLSSILVYLGLPLVIVGAATHFFGTDDTSVSSKNAASAANARH
jgi:uncharacterized membrane protein HdeD (DUF308 family)